MKLLKLTILIIEQLYKLSNIHTIYLGNLYMKLVNKQISDINKKS